MEIIEALKDRNLRAVARATGLHHNTLSRIRSGVSKPTLGTRLILRSYLGLPSDD